MRARRRVGARRGAVLRPGQADAGARHRPGAQRHAAARRADPDRAPRARLGGAGARRRPADRDHEGRRPAVALQRPGQPLRVAAVAVARGRAQRRLTVLRRPGLWRAARWRRRWYSCRRWRPRRAAGWWSGPAVGSSCPCSCRSRSHRPRCPSSVPSESAGPAARRRRPRAPAPAWSGRRAPAWWRSACSRAPWAAAPCARGPWRCASSAMALAWTMKSCQMSAG